MSKECINFFGPPCIKHTERYQGERRGGRTKKKARKKRNRNYISRCTVSVLTLLKNHTMKIYIYTGHQNEVPRIPEIDMHLK